MYATDYFLDHYTQHIELLETNIMNINSGLTATDEKRFLVHGYVLSMPR